MCIALYSNPITGLLIKSIDKDELYSFFKYSLILNKSSVLSVIILIPIKSQIESTSLKDVKGSGLVNITVL